MIELLLSRISISSLLHRIWLTIQRWNCSGKSMINFSTTHSLRAPITRTGRYLSEGGYYVNAVSSYKPFKLTFQSLNPLIAYKTVIVNRRLQIQTKMSVAETSEFLWVPRASPLRLNSFEEGSSSWGGTSSTGWCVTFPWVAWQTQFLLNSVK